MKPTQRTQSIWNSLHALTRTVISPVSGSQSPSTAIEDAVTIRNKKIQAWRQRVLLKKAYGLHQRMGDAANHSLAVLDEYGFVIAWYDRGRSTRADDVLERHVSQFYMTTDIASDMPARHLKSALLNGSSIRRGWRLHHDGISFWGTTTITPILLRDGRLQGFSHLTHVAADAPGDGVAVADQESSSRDDNFSIRLVRRSDQATAKRVISAGNLCCAPRMRELRAQHQHA